MQLNPDRRITLREVATAAGVSLATASYAINGKTAVSPATRERVLAAAKELGYRRTRIAREPGSRAMTRIGAVLSPTFVLTEEPNYYIAELLGGVQAEAAARRFQVEVRTWGDDDGAALADGGVAGILYLGGSFPSDLAAPQGIEAIVVGTMLPNSSIDAVLADNRVGAYAAVSHLIAQGKRRIGFINGPSRTLTSEEKLLGYREALYAHGIEPDSQLIRIGDFTIASGYRLTQDLLAVTSRPDALFIADDPMAVGALHALEDVGVQVPREIAIVGYGDSPAGLYLRPTLSTVRVFQQRMGVLATRRLLDRLAGDAEEQVRILVSPSLVVRESSAR